MAAGGHRSLEEASALVEANVGWAAEAAKGIAWNRGLPTDAAFGDMDEYVQDGMLGLIDAAASWDGTGDFRTWAMRRVFGSIMDGARARDHVSRHDRGRERDGLPIVDKKGVPMPVGRVSLALKPAKGHDGTSEQTLEDLLREPGMGPEDELLWDEMVAELWAAVEALPERLRKTIERHYREGMLLADVGASFGVTESRASQLHHQALRRLRRACRLAA